jgi:hypothetical protein
MWTFLFGLFSLILCPSVLGALAHLESIECIIDTLKLNNFQGKYSFSNDDEVYMNVTDVDNGRCSVDPLVILWPISNEDVSIGITTSKHCNIGLSVISGGHSAACFSLYEEGITLSLSEMSSIQPNLHTGQIRVQAGK